MKFCLCVPIFDFFVFLRESSIFLVSRIIGYGFKLLTLVFLGGNASKSLTKL